MGVSTTPSTVVNSWTLMAPMACSSAVRCGAVRCGAVRCGAVRCGVVRCGAVRCGAVRCGAVRCGAVGVVGQTPAAGGSHRWPGRRSSPGSRSGALVLVDEGDRGDPVDGEGPGLAAKLVEALQEAPGQRDRADHPLAAGALRV